MIPNPRESETLPCFSIENPKASSSLHLTRSRSLPDVLATRSLVPNQEMEAKIDWKSDGWNQFFHVGPLWRRGSAIETTERTREFKDHIVCFPFKTRVIEGFQAKISAPFGAYERGHFRWETPRVDFLLWFAGHLPRNHGGSATRPHDDEGDFSGSTLG